MRDLVRTFGTYVLSAWLIENLVRSRPVAVLTTRTAKESCIYEAHTHTHTWRSVKFHE